MLQSGKNIRLIRELAEKTRYEFAKILDVKTKKGNFSEDKIYTYEETATEAPDLIIQKVADLSDLSFDDIKKKELRYADINKDKLLKNINKVISLDGRVNEYVESTIKVEKTVVEIIDDLIQDINKKDKIIESLQTTQTDRNLNKKLDTIINNQKELIDLIVSFFIATYPREMEAIANKLKKNSVTQRFYCDREIITSNKKNSTKLKY